VNVGRIERARVLNAWTRKHLAGVAHVTPKTLTDMCSGRRRPTFGTVQAICAALGLTVADVIMFEDDANPESAAGCERHDYLPEPHHLRPSARRQDAVDPSAVRPDQAS
jgi:transcriptional regulator with XRE-family HTH domain